MLWSRLFPFLLVMMSLTGAFYPAVDLCAGEKERGTMETLLDQSGEPVRDRAGEVPDGDAGERDDGGPQLAEHGADGRPACAPGRVRCRPIRPADRRRPSRR